MGSDQANCFFSAGSVSSLGKSQKLKERIEFMKHRPVEELYDLTKDPGCWNNLADDEGHQQQLSQFRATLKREMMETNDPERHHYTH